MTFKNIHKRIIPLILVTLLATFITINLTKQANANMFGLFKKKSEKDKLYELYQKLTKDAHRLSTTNRKQSDQKVYEAEEIMKK